MGISGGRSGRGGGCDGESVVVVGFAFGSVTASESYLCLLG